MARAVLVVPPLVKYAAGPLLGPCMLAGAARQHGHDADVLDLNNRWLRNKCHRLWSDQAARNEDIGIRGDHDKPRDALSSLEAEWVKRCNGLIAMQQPRELDIPWPTAPACNHEQLASLVLALEQEQEGEWIRTSLENIPRPDVVGLSLMFGGQVVWAHLAASVVRKCWPGVPLVAGGAHITALRHEIAKDKKYGARIDRFVFGYAEKTFCDLLRALDAKGPWPAECVSAGHGGECQTASDDGDQEAAFDDLPCYGVPRLTVPAQYSRGCAFGRCRFCTYPAVEGVYRTLEGKNLAAALRVAERSAAVLSLKDSLVVPDRLEEVGERIAGRAEWSACTKLHRRLDTKLMKKLWASGCRTLELGVETFVASSQGRIDKPQNREVFLGVIDAAAAAGVALVLNCITGFPGEDESEAKDGLEWTRQQLAARSRSLRWLLEHNRFQLERLAPMRQDADVEVVQSWPWASVLAWRSIGAKRGVEVSLTVRRSVGRVSL